MDFKRLLTMAMLAIALALSPPLLANDYNQDDNNYTETSQEVSADGLYRIDGLSTLDAVATDLTFYDGEPLVITELAPAQPAFAENCSLFFQTTRNGGFFNSLNDANNFCSNIGRFTGLKSFCFVRDYGGNRWTSHFRYTRLFNGNGRDRRGVFNEYFEFIGNRNFWDNRFVSVTQWRGTCY